VVLAKSAFSSASASAHLRDAFTRAGLVL
jgi:hypothetical protein